MRQQVGFGGRLVQRSIVGIPAKAAVAAVALFLACGCASWHPFGMREPGPFARFTKTESGEFVHVGLYRRISIDLPDKVGYKWGMTEKPDPRILRTAQYKPATEELEGEPMVLVYFEAVGQGITSFKLEQRPDKGSGPAIDRFSLTVEVRSSRFGS